MDEMMGQYSRRFRFVDTAKSACAQVSNEAAQRCTVSDETAIAGPGDKIDMDVNLNNAAHRRDHAPWCRARDRAETASGKERQEPDVEAIPWWHQNPECLTSKKGGQPFPAGRKLGRHLLARALGGEFILLPTGRVVGMPPTVLKNSEAWRQERSCCASEPHSEARFGGGRYDRQGDRYLPGNRDDAIKTRARRCRVVITPPQRCDPFRFPPTVELVDQIGPSRRHRRSITGSCVIRGSYR